MYLTVGFAHLESKPSLVIGERIRRGQTIGRMGNTGFSTAPHLHISCVQGQWYKPWRLSDMENYKAQPDPKQLNFFIDDELFNFPIHITSYYADPDYMRQFGKLHLAYDVVPQDRHEGKENFNIFWNRSMHGVVLFNDFDRAYGNILLVRYGI